MEPKAVPADEPLPIVGDMGRVPEPEPATKSKDLQDTKVDDMVAPQPKKTFGKAFLRASPILCK